MFKKILALVLFGGATVANALECSVWATAVSRSLFGNTGTFATSGAALLAVPECVAKNGYYGNVFLSVPLREFDNGDEIDVRVGKRFQIGGLDVDASLADYYFGVGQGVKLNTIDGRVRVARTLSPTASLSVTPYGLVDYQRSTSTHSNTVGLSGGVVTNWKLSSLPGKPTLGSELSAWYYPTTPNASKGPIWAFDLSVEYPVGRGVVFGPRARWTRGDVTNANDPAPKSLYGIFVFAPL